MLNSLLKEIGSGCSVEITPSMEMIQVQENDYVVPKITEIFTKLKKRVADMGYVKSVKYFKDKEFNKLINELDHTITKRFGMNFKHVADDRSGYATMSAAPTGTSNTIKKYNIEIMANTKAILKTYGENNLDKDDILDYDENYLAILTKHKNAIESLNKTLNGEGIQIDLHKARIDGLPKDYLVFLFITPHYMMTQINLSPEELTAILLHEVGHAFTHLEYSYRNISTTSVLLDTLSDELKKNKPTKEVLKMVYENTTGNSGKDLDNMNLINATLTTINGYLQVIRQPDYNYHNYTDSEQLADQFASRMGLGLELVSGLDKWNRVMGVVEIVYVDIDDVSIKLLAISSLIMGIYSGVTIAVIMIPIITLFYTLVIKLVMDNDSTLITTYDDDYNRFKRIRNDLIKRLRTTNLDKKYVKKIIADIEYTDNVLSGYTPTDISNGWFKKLYYSVRKDKINYLAVRQMEEMVEDLNENNLYLAGTKLKTIQG